MDKKSHLNTLWEQKSYLKTLFYVNALFIIVIVCLLLEMFVFNARSFITLWGDGPVNMSTVQAKDLALSGVDKNEDGSLTPNNGTQITFSNLNRRVADLYIDVEFDGPVYQDFTVNYGDQENSDRTAGTFRVISGAKNSRYMMLPTYGKVNNVTICCPSDVSGIKINTVILNQPVPFQISWARIIIYAVAAFFLVVIIRNKLFSKPLRQKSMKQKGLFAGIAGSFVIYLFILMLLTEPFSIHKPFADNFKDDGRDQYNADIVDALIKGHAYMNFEPTESLMSMKNPYDFQERSDNQTAGAPWDFAYYNGKFYSYFGIVQVLALSLPYKLITGNYIQTRVAVFLFAAAAGVFLMLIWRRLAYRFMKKMSLGLFSLGQLTVVMCSMLTFLVSRPMFYEVAGTSAMCFTALGLWLILGYAFKQKGGHLQLLFGCLSMALAVGCRPNYVLASLLVPIILYDKIKQNWHSKKALFKTFAFAAAPYAVVGGGLMWYNYIRFDSVFEFGNKYMLTVTNVGSAGLLNPIYRVVLIAACAFCLMVPALSFSTAFPYVSLQGTEIGGTYSGYLYKENVLGILAFPFVWALAGIGFVIRYIDKKRKMAARLIIAMLIIGLAQIVVISYIGLATRYELDFFWLFVIPGLMCAYFIVEGIEKRYRDNYPIRSVKNHSINIVSAVNTVFAASMICSIVFMFLLLISSSNYNLITNSNPQIYYRFKQLLGVVPFT